MGLFSWIGDIVSDVFGGTTGRKDQQKYNVQNMAIQQEYARQNMADQNYYNVQAFERENAYNSPLAQQQRNYAAGVNPMWSDSGQVVGQQDSAVSAAAPSGAMPSAGNFDFLGSLASLLSLKSNIQKNKSEIDLNKAKENEIDAKTPGEVVNLEANAKALFASAFKTEQEATYYYTDLVKKWEHLGFENMSLSAAINRIEELLPFEKDKMEAEKYQACYAAALSFVLAKCKPQEVAIQQQNANANTQNAVTNAKNAVTQAKAVEYQNQHWQREDRIAMQNAATMLAGQREGVRHNKVMEGLERYNQTTLAYLRSAQGQNLDAQTVNERIKNTFDYELYSSGMMMTERHVQIEKMSAELKRLEQEYTKSKPSVTYAEWVYKKLQESPGELNGLYLWNSMPWVDNPIEVK